MLINPETKLCISLASQPGKFGATIHNAGYQALGLNYIYKPCVTHNLEQALNGVKALGIRGCSISMPFKEEALAYLDEINEDAKVIGAINTIVNNFDKLRGYNTDVIGVYRALQEEIDSTSQKIIILGGGGVTRAIIQALKLLKQTDITIKVRNVSKYEYLAERFMLKISHWSEEMPLETTCLINATPLGMHADDKIDISFAGLRDLKIILDMVVAKNTALTNFALSKNIKMINGWQVALYQAFAQFNLYTGVPAPEAVMYQAAKHLW